MQYKVGYSTDIGMKRKQNQDNGGAFADLGLFVVSDGMGGHLGGETASSTAVASIQEFVKKQEDKSAWNPLELVGEAIRFANKEIYKVSSTQPELQGMGTTTTALLFRDHLLIIGHVGDSRCYFLRPGGIWQLTRDHSLVQEKLRAGLIDREAARKDKMKNVITRSVGFEERVDVDLYQMEIQAGDAFLLCSDGLTTMLDDSEILGLLQNSLFKQNNLPQESSPPYSLQESADLLIETANKEGGEDNITALLVQVN